MAEKDFDETSSSNSETSESEIDIWKPPRRPVSDCPSTSKQQNDCHSIFLKKFDELRNEQNNAKQAKLEANSKRKKRRKLLRREKAAQKRMAQETEIEENRSEKEWQKVKQFMGVYDHIHGPIAHGKYGPKTELEHMINDSLVDGNVGKAQELSDQIANRELGLKISRAFAAKKATEKKLKVDKEKEAKKRKRLVWGFEDKERWQMKGNM